MTFGPIQETPRLLTTQIVKRLSRRWTMDWIVGILDITKCLKCKIEIQTSKTRAWQFWLYLKNCNVHIICNYLHICNSWYAMHEVTLGASKDFLMSFFLRHYRTFIGQSRTLLGYPRTSRVCPRTFLWLKSSLKSCYRF